MSSNRRHSCFCWAWSWLWALLLATAAWGRASESLRADYTREGLKLQSDDGDFTAVVNARAQVRSSWPFSRRPRTAQQFDAENKHDLRLRRARLKASGQAGAPWIEYGYEHDLIDGRLLDLRVDIGPKWLRLRAGQWKADYSRERVDSSGELQLVDRSIVNRPFTIDRQKGAMALGRVGEDERWDSQYFAGVFTGHGRSLSPEQTTPGAADDGEPLWMLRYQWNALGGGVEFSQSDLERSATPRLSMAVGASGNSSRYTRFSSGGGGQLEGFDPGSPGRYRIRQQVEDVAFQYRGFSAQHEFHWKSIFDHVRATRTELRGSYTQAGLFPSVWTKRIPEQLEVAGRFAFVDRRGSGERNTLREFSAAVNWFFDGHRHKLSAQLSRYSLQGTTGARRSTPAFRAQWDLTL